MNKREYTLTQKQTRPHKCHWPGCKKQVPSAMWGCREHWFKLPLRLRNKIWCAYQPGQEIDMTPSEEYLQVAKDVENWIRMNTVPVEYKANRLTTIVKNYKR